MTTAYALARRLAIAAGTAACAAGRAVVAYLASAVDRGAETLFLRAWGLPRPVIDMGAA